MPANADDANPQQPTQPKPASGGNNVKVFDDGVFNLQSQQNAPPTTKTSPRGNTYYTAEEPNYNSQQRGNWIKSCEHLAENPQAYRDCFNAEKTADLKKTNPEVVNTSGAGGGKSGSPSRNKNSIEKVSDPYDSMKDGSQPSNDDD